MTEKHPSPKLVGPEEPSLSDDPTTVDGVASPDSESPERRSDSEPPQFNPYGYSVVTVPPNLRQEMLQAKLPRLAPEYFQDTLPPNQLLQAPPLVSDDELEPAVPTAKRRPATAIVVACLLGAAVLLALALVRYSGGQPEPTPAPPKGIAAQTVPAQPAASVTSAPLPPKSPEQSPPPKREADQPPEATPSPHAAASTHPKASAISKPTQPALTSPPAAPPSSAAPAQPSWVTPR